MATGLGATGSGFPAYQDPATSLSSGSYTEHEQSFTVADVAGEDTFLLSFDPVDKRYCEVFINSGGTLSTPTQDDFELVGQSVVLDTAAAQNDVVTVRYRLPVAIVLADEAFLEFATVKTDPVGTDQIAGLDNDAPSNPYRKFNLSDLPVSDPTQTALDLKADQTAVDAALALKADQTALDAGLALKADQADVDAALALKADQTDVDAGLALKADQTDVDAALALKADQSSVDAALALKADQTAVDAGLALKADQADVDTALALKADQTALDDGLALKADQTALDAGLATKEPLAPRYDAGTIIGGVKDADDNVVLGYKGDGSVTMRRDGETIYNSDTFYSGFKDPDDNVVMGIRFDGSVSLRRDMEVIYPSTDFVWGLKDNDDNVILGITTDGLVSANLDPASVPSAPIAPSEVLGMDGEEVSGAINYDAGIRRFMSNADGDTTAYLQRRDLLSTTSIIERRTLHVTMGYGQSLGIGGGVGDPVFTDTAESPRMAMMFNTGVRGTGDTTAWDDTAVTDLVGAFEKVEGVKSETPGSGLMLYRIDQSARDGLPRNAYFHFAAGAGGQTIESLAVGSQPWLNLLAGLDKVIEIAALYKMDVVVDGFIWTHGEANSEADIADYRGKLEAIIAAFRSECDTRGVTPSAGAVPVFMDQLSTPAGGSGSGRSPNDAFLEIEAADARAWVSCPKYQFEVVDTVHLTSWAYRQMGELIGRAVHSVEQTGDWQGCQITGAAIVGDTVEVTVHVPSGDLVRDTSTVPAVTNDGFLYADDTSSASITGVTIGATSGNTCTVTLQLDATPTGANPSIQYCYDATQAVLPQPNFGVVGNLRDSDTTPSAVPSGTGGTGTLNNWLMIQPPLAL